MEFYFDKGIQRGKRVYTCCGCLRKKEIGYPWHVCGIKEGFKVVKSEKTGKDILKSSFCTSRVCWVCQETLRCVRPDDGFSEGEVVEYDEWGEFEDMIEKDGIAKIYHQKEI